ncbi:hypothetical protein HDU87_007501 [Geranomyces variabilis]|uniref:Uncharacterized protein n=1 Tax=Geranomyces variabilis TaxID=109894 RepID=A0AAD5XTP1_9FUNG|nr:hypothetical protein HDU87_007501 [Geranomyces variabilis]
MSTARKPPLPSLLPFAEPASLFREGTKSVRKLTPKNPANALKAKGQPRSEPALTSSTRRDDELAIKYQQLQSLLREAYQDIAALQNEVAVLRRTIAGGANSPPPPSVDSDASGPDVEDTEIALETCRLDLASAIARCAACPICSLISENAEPTSAAPESAHNSVSMVSADMPWLAGSKDFTLHDAEQYFDDVVADYAGKRASKVPTDARRPDSDLNNTRDHLSSSALNKPDDVTQRQSVTMLMQEPVVGILNYDVLNAGSIAKTVNSTHEEELEEELVKVYRQLRKAKQELREIRE